MKTSHILLTILFLFNIEFSVSQTQNVVVVIIDGARYSETFGDPSHTYIPKMAELAADGTLISTFYNNGTTYTSKAVPALWCGTWSGVQPYNDTQYTIDPSLFEYYRKQKNKPATQSIHELTYVSSLWLQSFHTSYGETYWPYTVSQGSTDEGVVNQAKADMANYQPKLLWVYLPNVDHEGHGGVWANYTHAIKTADSLVNELWIAIQDDPFYKDNTSLLVTNDHGRHTTDFSGHGCSCDGCRHIMFLALGPDIKKDYISTGYRILPDFAVTAASILDVDMEFATGNVAQEIFIWGTDIQENNSKHVKITNSYCTFSPEKEQFVSIQLIDVWGRVVKIIESKTFNAGYHDIQYNITDLHGIYFININGETFNYTQKLMLH